MALFSKKRKIGLEDFCREFYGLILNPMAGYDGDYSGVFPDTVKEMVSEFEPVFADVNNEQLKDELRAIQFELFALAWTHGFGYESAINQSIFTKRFLDETGHLDVWENMDRYNNAVSTATTNELDPHRKARIITLRADIADEAIEAAEKNGQVIDESIGRPINRYRSDTAWKNGLTAYYMIIVLWRRLGLDSDKPEPNEESVTHLAYFMRMLYEAAQESMGDVKIVEGQASENDCSECGQPFEPTNKFCQNCGAAIERA